MSRYGMICGAKMVKLGYLRAKLLEKVLPFILHGLHSIPSSSSSIFLTSTPSFWFYSALIIMVSNIIAASSGRGVRLSPVSTRNTENPLVIRGISYSTGLSNGHYSSKAR